MNYSIGGWVGYLANTNIPQLLPNWNSTFTPSGITLELKQFIVSYFNNLKYKIDDLNCCCNNAVKDWNRDSTIWCQLEERFSWVN